MNTYFNFENTYTNLPKCFFTEQEIKQVSSPDLVIFNDKLAKGLDINIPLNNENESAKILSGNFIKKYRGKIINIHPSLLPKYKGLNTHRRVIENKEKYTGCTVHYVNNKLDSGKIISQKNHWGMIY